MDYVADAADAEFEAGIIGTDRNIRNTLVIPVIVRIPARCPDIDYIIVHEPGTAGICHISNILDIIKISILAHKHKFLLIRDSPCPGIRAVGLLRIC